MAIFHKKIALGMILSTSLEFKVVQTALDFAEIISNGLIKISKVIVLDNLVNIRLKQLTFLVIFTLETFYQLFSLCLELFGGQWLISYIF